MSLNNPSLPGGDVREAIEWHHSFKDGCPKCAEKDAAIASLDQEIDSTGRVLQRLQDERDVLKAQCAEKDVEIMRLRGLVMLITEGKPIDEKDSEIAHLAQLKMSESFAYSQELEQLKSEIKEILAAAFDKDKVIEQQAIKLSIAREALKEAASSFRNYEMMHMAKGPDGFKKAEANAAKAWRMEKSLEQIGEHPRPPVEVVCHCACCVKKDAEIAKWKTAAESCAEAMNMFKEDSDKLSIAREALKEIRDYEDSEDAVSTYESVITTKAQKALEQIGE